MRIAGPRGKWLSARPRQEAPLDLALGFVGELVAGGGEIACDLAVGLALAGGLHRLPRQIGLKRAMGMILTARRVSAAEGEQLGFVNAVVPAAELMARARAVADKICGQAPDVLRMTKQLLRQGMTVSFDNIMELSASMQALAHHTSDHKEALDAFFDKRPANYKGE